MKKFRLLFGITSAILMTYSLFLAGFYAGKHDYTSMFPNLVLAVLWFGGLVFIHLDSISDVRLDSFDRELKTLEHVAAVTKNLADEADGRHDTEVLTAILKDMGFQKKMPKPNQLLAIEQAFHQHSDNYVKLRIAGSNELDVKFARQPWPEKPAEPGTSKESKSQQRRKNTVKVGKPVTDQQIRDERNAKRRAKRAAKKPVPTTTTTTLPGQQRLA